MVVERISFSSIGGFEVAGAGVYLPASELAFDGLIWGTAEEYGDARLERCRAFLPVPGVMQTVQRAEFWGAIVALQAYWPCHVQQGRVRVVDQQGNAEADAAADLGRRHQSEIPNDAWRRLLQARGHWYPIMSDLHCCPGFCQS